MKEVVLDFMWKYTSIYKIENIAYFFRLFIANSLRNTHYSEIETVYQRYLMATSEMDNYGCFPAFDSDNCN